MRQAPLLVLNTIVSYSGVLIRAVAGLVTIRLLLDVMGEENYGLFAALVASGALLTVIQAGIADGARRHLSIEVGAKNTKGLISVFSCTVLLMTLATAAVIGVGLLATDAVISCCQITPDRIPACKATYFFSVATLGLTVFSVPWQGMLYAKQQLVAITAISTLRPILALVAAIALYFLPGDKLVAYAALTTLIVSACQTGLILHCIRKNPESVFRFRAIEMGYLKSITTFGGWIVFESFAMALREKGAVLLLSAFFGPVITAAYDVAQKVGNQLLAVGQTISSVVSPALTNAEGRGDSKFATRLGDILSCYASYGVSFLMVPFLFEAPLILNLVFVHASDNMILFARIIVLTKLAGLMSWGDGVVAKSQNRFAVISVGLFIPFVFAFLACYAVFRSGKSPVALLPLSMLAVTAWGSFWFRPWRIRKLNGMKWRTYAVDVLLKIGLSLLPAILAAWMVHVLLPESIIRLSLVTLVYFVVAAASIWKFGLSDLEKSRLVGVFKTVKTKMLQVAQRSPSY